MCHRYNRILKILIFFFILGLSASAYANTLYVTDGDSSRLAIVDTNTGTLLDVKSTFARGYPLSIRDSIWIGDYSGNTSHEYTLAGDPTGNTASAPDINAVDGAVNSSTNYALGNAFNDNATVYSANSDWSNPVQMFNVTGSDLVGITFDSVSGHLWISDINTIYEYDLVGNPISSFNHSSNRGALAYDPSTDTLWYVTNASDTITQYSKNGALLQTMTVTGLSSNNWGAEFANVSQTQTVPTMNEYGTIIFIVLAGLGAAYYLRRQRKAEK